MQIQNVGLTDLANGYNFLINDKNFGQYLSTNLRSSGGDIPFKTEWLIPQLKVLVLAVTAAGRGLPDGLVALDPEPPHSGARESVARGLQCDRIERLRANARPGIGGNDRCSVTYCRLDVSRAVWKSPLWPDVRSSFKTKFR